MLLADAACWCRRFAWQASEGHETAQRALRKMMRSPLAREAMGRMRPRRSLETTLALHIAALTAMTNLEARFPYSLRPPAVSRLLALRTWGRAVALCAALFCALAL